MKRHPILTNLSRDHHFGLITAQYIKKDAPVYRGMPTTPEAKKAYVSAFFDEHLKDHFHREETILFPFIIQTLPGLAPLVATLKAEHESMAAAIDALQTVADVVSHLDNLGKQMESHIRKEERNLFHQLQQKLTAEQWEALSLKFEQG